MSDVRAVQRRFIELLAEKHPNHPFIGVYHRRELMEQEKVDIPFRQLGPLEWSTRVDEMVAKAKAAGMTEPLKSSYVNVEGLAELLAIVAEQDRKIRQLILAVNRLRREQRK